MHGEHKTPGGKMVVVDLDRVDDRLRNVEVSGDFFLYPDELLTAVTSALEGLDATLDQETIADHVRRAIPEGAEMLGTSPQGIAIAVQRALRERET
ncbi:MAG: biotin--protein ligase [Chloroflexia bacterium]|nr:biotin--protein ligase [Chloroflexia bacterium]